MIDNADFFGPAGLQSNPQGEGIAWERFTPVEIIDPNGGPEIQLNAGLRMQGNASRSTTRPKHNMRLLFNGIYGAKKLKFPLFEDSSVEKFDTIILRGGNEFVELMNISGAPVSLAGWHFSAIRYTFDQDVVFGQSIRADKLLIELSGSVSDGVRDESGLPLDGNWTNATSMFPSGNGVIDAEDSFRFRIDVVGGDVTDDGQVDRADLVDLIFAMGDRGESRRRDLTGDDLTAIRTW